MTERQVKKLEEVIARSIEKHYFPVGAHSPKDQKINIYGYALAECIAKDIITKFPDIGEKL